MPIPRYLVPRRHPLRGVFLQHPSMFYGGVTISNAYAAMGDSRDARDQAAVAAAADKPVIAVAEFTNRTSTPQLVERRCRQTARQQRERARSRLKPIPRGVTP